MSELKKVAAINDMSGSSRCSLTVAIPILSAFGMQCCALPTAILSNHTGYDKYFFEDYTDNMKKFAENWKYYDNKFDCIYSGFLGSAEQIDIAENFFNTFKESNTKIIVDPVMGDDGEMYSTYTKEMCDKMKRLIRYADVVTPNVTEASILSGIKFKGDDISTDEARRMADIICSYGTENVIITGIKRDGNAINYVYNKENGEHEYMSPMVPVYYSGTGDVFASLICGFLANDKPIHEGVEFATEFIRKSAKYSYEHGVTYLEGICFEKFLKEIVCYE